MYAAPKASFPPRTPTFTELTILTLSVAWRVPEVGRSFLKSGRRAVFHGSNIFQYGANVPPTYKSLVGPFRLLSGENMRDWAFIDCAASPDSDRAGYNMVPQIANRSDSLFLFADGAQSPYRRYIAKRRPTVSRVLPRKERRARMNQPRGISRTPHVPKSGRLPINPPPSRETNAEARYYMAFSSGGIPAHAETYRGKDVALPP